MSKLSKNLSAVEIADSAGNYCVIQTGGSIGETGFDYRVGGSRVRIIEENLSPEEAKQKAAQYRKLLSPGEKSYYRINYKAVPKDNLHKIEKSSEVSDSTNKVTDEAWSEADHAAAFAINADDVVDLYLDGIMEVEIPSGVDSKEFAESCIKMCKELWSDEEVNFDYGDVEFNYVIDDNKLIITII